nr:MAG TPA: hypothetical protein [Caudoviricetes sp.]
MRLIDVEKVAKIWKSTGQKRKDDAEKLMMSNKAEDFIKGAIEEACAEMLIGLADSLLKDVPSDPIHEAFFEWRNPETDPPKVETEVLVLYRNDIDGYDITTAHYEDGSVFLQDSVWCWEDLPDWGTYDEEQDDYKIPKGWWEYRHFNPDEIYNNRIDRPVMGWMPLPPKEVKQ